MTIQEYWLNDEELIRLSRRMPSMAFGIELMRDAWPQMFRGVCRSSEYRGVAIVLSMLLAQVPTPIGLPDLGEVVNRVDRCLKASKTLDADPQLRGGAVLEGVNAWKLVHQSDLATDLIVASWESKLIYTAKMFVAARQQGL